MHYFVLSLCLMFFYRRLCLMFLKDNKKYIENYLFLTYSIVYIKELKKLNKFVDITCEHNLLV